MIRIKEYIFNDNQIIHIEEIEEKNKLIVRTSRDVWFDIPNATFEDIEWKYDEDLAVCKNLSRRMSELEDIRLKALKYLVSNTVLSDRWEEISQFSFIPTGAIEVKSLSKDKVNELFKILKGEE